jgi:hypothetical protein
MGLAAKIRERVEQIQADINLLHSDALQAYSGRQQSHIIRKRLPRKLRVIKIHHKWNGYIDIIHNICEDWFKNIETGKYYKVKEYFDTSDKKEVTVLPNSFEFKITHNSKHAFKTHIEGYGFLTFTYKWLRNN